MTVKRRTRPGGVRPKMERPISTLEPLNSPHPGCCKPYPDATFVNQRMVKLYAHHKGPYCKGYLEPIPLEDWNDELAIRASARSRNGGHER